MIGHRKAGLLSAELVNSIQMNPAPKVSVIIPTFNRVTLLKHTLDTVLAQHHRDLEIIVVDDGSTDDTASMVAALVAGADGRVRYLHHANCGLNASRNRGIAVARGEFLAVLDDDDLWEPAFLSLLLGLLEKFPQAGFAFSNFSIQRGGTCVSRDGLRGWHPGADFVALFGNAHQLSPAALGVHAALPATVAAYVTDIYAAALTGPWVLPAAGLIRRAAIPAGLTFNEQDSTCGDWEFFARLSRASGAVFVDTDVAINRSHEGVRLTRLPQATQLARRVAMIDRLWRADPEFMRLQGGEVDLVLHDCLVLLARLQLLDADRAAARATLSRAVRLRPGTPSAQRTALRIASALPGAGTLLRALQELRHRLAS